MPLVQLNGFLYDRDIGSDTSYEEIRRLVMDGTIVILKCVFDAEELLIFRRKVQRWGKCTDCTRRSQHQRIRCRTAIAPNRPAQNLRDPIDRFLQRQHWRGRYYLTSNLFRLRDTHNVGQVLAHSHPDHKRRPRPGTRAQSLWRLPACVSALARRDATDRRAMSG